MNNMVEEFDALNPDLVVIAGDIFDNEYDALDDPAKLAATLRTIQSTYGVYACYGNHDIQEKILAGFTFHQDEAKASDPRMDVFLADANIHLLQDEGVLIDDSFYLYGRGRLRAPRPWHPAAPGPRRNSPRTWTRASPSWSSTTSRGSCKNWPTPGWTWTSAATPTTARCTRQLNDPPLLGKPLRLLAKGPDAQHRHLRPGRFPGPTCGWGRRAKFAVSTCALTGQNNKSLDFKKTLIFPTFLPKIFVLSYSQDFRRFSMVSHLTFLALEALLPAVVWWW